jgi:DNA-binding MarR family transcriptional regulator
MARGRPLTQARLLWEIGPGGAEVAALRARLGLDSGYLSRLLRTLESDGLVTVGPADQVGGDGRVRAAVLTDAGRAEWAELDKRSDEFAWSILEPLTERRRERLAATMAEVERLLIASMVAIEPCPPGDPRARACMRAYRDIAHRFDDGNDPALSNPVHDEELVPPAGVFLRPGGVAGRGPVHHVPHDLIRLGRSGGWTGGLRLGGVIRTRSTVWPRAISSPVWRSYSGKSRWSASPGA